MPDLCEGGKNVFYDANTYALISDTARHYIGGIIAARSRAIRICSADYKLLPPVGARL